MLVAQAEAAGCEAWRGEILPDDPDTIAAAVRDAAHARRPRHRRRRLERRPRRPHRTRGRAARDARRARRRRAARAPGRARRGGRDAGPRRARLPGVGRADLRHLRRAAARGARGRRSPPRRRGLGRGSRRKLASPMGMDDWVRVRLGRVGGELVATPLPRGAGVLTSLVRADGLLVVPAGLEGHHAGEEVDVVLLRGVGEIDRTILAVGSHDLVLDLAASEVRAADPRVTLASSNVGSLGGLVALRDGLCHVAGSHLLDPESGRVHAALRRPRARRPRRRGRAARAPRAGAHRRGGQPARARRHRGSHAARACATSTASAAPAPACSSTTSWAARHRPRCGLRLRPRGAHASRGGRRGRGRARRRRARACSRPPGRSAWTSCP